MKVLLRRIALFLAMKYRFRFFSGRRLARFHQRRLRRVCSYAAEKAPFFRRYFGEHRLSRLTIEQLNLLPPVDKRAMMDNFDTYNTVGLSGDALVAFARENDRRRTYDRYFDEQYSVGLSSGTSGSVGLAVYSKEEVTDSIFKFMARNGMPSGLKRHNIMFALRTSVPGFGAVNRFGYKLVHYNYDTPMEEVVAGINHHELNILAGSPTFLLQLVPFAEKIAHPVDVVISYAEILEGHVRKELERAFGAPVHQLYAATECYLAASCRLGTLHLNEDLVAINLLPVPDRENVYSMTVTDLYRKTQPIINYALNDLVEIDDRPCACGSSFRVVKQIIGRADDYLLLPQSPGEEVLVYADYIRRAIISVAERLSEYRVTQISKRRVEVELEFPDGAADEEKKNREKEICARVHRALEELFIRYVDTLPEIIVTTCEQIGFPPDAKRKRVVRAIPSP